MDTETNPAPAAPRRTLLVRRGRGRTGGSTGLDLWIQRGREAGRRVKPLDGDLRSRTLSLRYPAQDEAGEPIPDGASSPSSEEPTDMQKWLRGELDLMAEGDGSAVLDLGGGDRVVQEFVRDLSLRDYCDELGVRLVEAYFLGPDLEDFSHVVEVARSRDLQAHKTLLVLNEGLVRHGQTTRGVFEPLTHRPEFRELVQDGAAVILLTRLVCMQEVVERGFGFYDAVRGAPDRTGRLISPTTRFLIRKWLSDHEAQHEQAGTLEWLP